MGPSDEDRHGRRVAGQEERAEDAHRRGHEEDHGEGRAAEYDRERDERRQDRSAEIGHEHHPLAVAPIGERPRDHPEEEIGQRRQRSDDTHPEARSRQCQDEQRQGGETDGITERGDALGREQDAEVVVASERQGFGHQRMVRA